MLYHFFFLNWNSRQSKGNTLLSHFSFLSLEPTGYTTAVTYIIHGQICTGLFLFALLCSCPWAPGRQCFVEVIVLTEIQPLPVGKDVDAPMLLHFNRVIKISLINSCFILHICHIYSFNYHLPKANCLLSLMWPTDYTDNCANALANRINLLILINSS